MDKLKAVKFLVAVLTFLLVLGTLSALTLIYRRAGHHVENSPAAAELNLRQPQGSRIARFLEKDGQLHILIKDGGMSDRILILSPDNQKIQQEIKIN